MMTLKSAALALTTVLCAASVTATAEARGAFTGGHIGHMGGNFGHVGHMGHMAHVGHVGHVGHGHWGHHHHGWYGPGFGVGFYEPYYSSYYDDDCYRVYRHHRWWTVCD